jgi:TDP-4-amino-4,6-dideoxy-D-glucose deaminase
MKLPASFKDSDHLETPLEILSASLKDSGASNLTIQVLRELFLKPYLPSKELCEKFSVGKEDIRSVYSLIRSSKIARDLFESSPYHYLASVLGGLSKDSERTSRILNGETPFPLSETMEVFVSEKCNAACKFCYRNGRTYDKQKVLSAQDYVNLINDFAGLHGKNLDVSGGLEPLLGPSILDLLKAGIASNLKVSLYTNGIALTNPDTIDCLMQIHSVRVSLSAYDEESYKEMMGVDRFAVVTNNMRNLVKAKKNSESNLRIGIHFLVFQGNYKHIFDVIKLAQDLGVDFLDLRTVEVTDMGYFDERQRKQLCSILKQIRQNNSPHSFDNLDVTVADTFSAITNPADDFSKYLKKDFVNALSNFRITVTPPGKVYALNLVGQPSREDERYLLGKTDKHGGLSKILQSKKTVPFERKLLLSHDITLVGALSKLKSDLEFGIGLEENPFNWE